MLLLERKAPGAGPHHLFVCINSVGGNEIKLVWSKFVNFLWIVSFNLRGGRDVFVDFFVNIYYCSYIYTYIYMSVSLCVCINSCLKNEYYYFLNICDL